MKLREVERVVSSNDTTPQSTPPRSEYPSEEDDDEEPKPIVKKKRQPFRFLDLPAELRVKVYSYLFASCPDVVDLDPGNFRDIHRKQAIFFVSRQVHREASHYFYSSRTFRIFPCYPGRFFKTKKPLLARMSPRCRSQLTSLELRLGPGFANPPRGWVVNDALGLKDMVNVRKLKVMVQIDTSNPFFKGFRAKGEKDEFYENFSKTLLDKVLAAIPTIHEVQIDAYESVQKDGAMITALLEIARTKHNKKISWGPERGWDKEKTVDIIDSILSRTAALRIRPEVAVH